MGLFNNLRHRIVEKLIRPEDGYTFTGFREEEPIKFYYQEDTGRYLLGMRSDTMYYFEPTLTGWCGCSSKHLPWGQTVDGYTYNQEPKEVSFRCWIFGILDNINKQYMDRLNSLTQKELRTLKKNENGDQLMINKESFCDIMTALDKYWKDLDALEDILNVVFEGNALTEVFDAVVDALCEDLEPDREFGENPVIWDWLFEMDAGRNELAQEGRDGHPLTSAGELYDYLVWKRDGKVDD